MSVCLASSPRSLPLLIALALIVLVISITTAIGFGSVAIPVNTVWGVALNHILPDTVEVAWSAGRDNIVWEIRFPRVLLGALVGAALATVGTVLQAATRNPLADPHLLGVSSGAALGAVVAMMHVGLIFGLATLPLFAFVGALLATGLVLGISRERGYILPDRLVISGVAVSFVCMALANLLIFLGDHRAAHSVIFWMLGGLGLAQWDQLWYPALTLASGLAFLLLQGRQINALMSGEETALTLGINTTRLRLSLFVVCALLTGVMVAFSGTIGFVGLMIPHVLRLLVGGDNRYLLPLSALTGAIFLVWVDVVARKIMAPEDLPIGIVTGLMGGIAFIWISRIRIRRTQ
ncbi:iron ABC transporter permease [Motiliproteus sp. MSK22-1]|uniref:FecCD family ABC transporter permease n=1 Tax=Motiliproteus sp. MSK22-1 TaxID=1897630 RepID=UPI00097667B2|nr:iron ABC transporter permease [Motiliproteus sp. MSK22-1]OMH25811.1 ABC transporter permease [Motiliproteus sp. MSK22-1]